MKASSSAPESPRGDAGGFVSGVARPFVVGALIVVLGAYFLLSIRETSATIDTSATALQLAQSLAVDTGQVTGASFVSVTGGTPNGRSDTVLAGFPFHGTNYAILTTGDALLAPNSNSSGSSGVNNGGGNVRGNTDFDVTILRIDLTVPSGVNCLVGLDFRFLSEEYPEFVGSSYNDAFIAELDTSNWTTSGSTISAPNNFAFDPTGNEISINAAGVTSMTAANAAGTTYDGATPVLRAKTPITPGAHSLYLSIFDQQDHIYDSAVFIDNVSLGTVSNPGTQCQTGALPVTDTEVLSVDSAEVLGNGSSTVVSLSGNGGFGAFASVATNLVSGDTNNFSDVFVRDRNAGTTERVSVDSSGVQANGTSTVPSISSDGRYVAFGSNASNLVASDTNGAGDVFVRDRQTSTTERISVSSSGTQGDAASYGVTPAAISADGRYVTFCSDASNLVAGDTNGTTDTFIRDRQTGTTERVSVSSSELEGNARSCENSGSAISADGNYIAFPSVATNLVSGDTNGQNDIFVRDRVAGTTQRVSVDSSGTQGNGLSAWPDLSADGRYVAFTSLATNLVAGDTNGSWGWDIFLHDRQTGITERTSISDGEAEANANSGYPSLSSDARYVAFFSYATNLVSGDTNGIGDVFVRDRQLATTTRVSVDSAGNQGTGPNTEIATLSISADGSVVAFFASMNNLVNNDNNSAPDVFVRGVGAPPPNQPTPTPGPTAPPSTPGPEPPPPPDSEFSPWTRLKLCNAMTVGFFVTDPALAGNPLCTENKLTGANADLTIDTDLPSGDHNFSRTVISLPSGMTTWPVSVGAKVGGMRVIPNYGLFNASCNTVINTDYVFWNVALPNNSGDPRLSTNIAWPQPEGTSNRFSRWKAGDGVHTGNPPSPSDPDWAGGSDIAVTTANGVQASGTTLSITNYPIHLLDAFDPDFVPGVGDGPAAPRVPTAVYGALTMIAGNWTPVYLAQFAAGGLSGLPAPLGDIGVNTGQPLVTVWNDPVAVVASPSSISDICSPISTSLMLLGITSDTSQIRSSNPGSIGTAMFIQYNASLRDTDGDGHENAIDTCPFNPSVADDPRPTPGAGDSDSDDDGIKDPCDVAFTPGSTDVDSDLFQNRQDNCPQVSNPTNSETEIGLLQPDKGPPTDDVGDPCDLGTLTITQNGRPVTIGVGGVLSSSVANGRYFIKTHVLPKCISGTDLDGDGYCTIGGVNTDNADSGACASTTPNSCYVRHFLWLTTSHPAFQQDSDGDTVTPTAGLISVWSDAAESYLGTDPTKPCAQDTPANNEIIDNWPLDFDDNRIVNGSDWLKVALAVNTGGPRPINVGGNGDGTATTSATITLPLVGTVYQQRFDLNFDGMLVLGGELGKFNAYMNKTCGSAGAPPTTANGSGTFQQ